MIHLDNLDTGVSDAAEVGQCVRTTIHIVDRDTARRARMAALVFAAGHHAEVYADDRELLAYAPKGGLVLAYDDPAQGAVVGLMKRMTQQGSWLPVVAMSEEPVISSVVETIKAGAIDYLACPRDCAALVLAIDAASKDATSLIAMRSRAAEARQRIGRLSVREREVLECVSEGCSNKEIARRLDISPRTVEIHRMKMMGKLGIRRSSEAVRLRIEAIGLDRSTPPAAAAA